MAVQKIDMLPPTNENDEREHGGHEPKTTKPQRARIGSIGPGPGGLATKGRYVPSEVEAEELGWGIIRLYRDPEETAGLYDEVSTGHNKSTPAAGRPRYRDDDCTTLCILAVPSYLTPSDFLGFVGEQTREAVSRFRMIRTERENRYMVLMKFRSGKRARDWRREWNGKSFNSTEVRK